MSNQANQRGGGEASFKANISAQASAQNIKRAPGGFEDDGMDNVEEGANARAGGNYNTTEVSNGRAGMQIDQRGSGRKRTNSAKRRSKWRGRR